jgi:hypothetical protein
LRSSLISAALGLVAGAFAVWLALGRPGGGAQRVGDREPAAAAAPGAAGPVVRLDAATRERIGLQVQPLAALELPDEVRGFGRLLDPVALSTPVYDREAARATFESSEREYRRVQTLQRGNTNASQRDLEAARAGFERDRAALAMAEAHLVSAWGSAGAAREDLPALAQSLVARKISIARIDLSLGESLPQEPVAGRIASIADAGTAAIEGTLLGQAPDVDPTTQGRGFLLLLEQAPWAPGTAVTAWLAISGPPLAGVDVPRSALVRHAGQTFVYEQTSEDGFVRRAVRLDRPTRQGWFVANGLAAGDRLVVTGAQQLLSAELAGSTAED